MSEYTDNGVWRVFEGSTIVRTIERGARALQVSASHSQAIALAQAWLRSALSRPGHLVLTASLTHIVLMSGIARPVSWQQFILPAIFSAAGLALMAFSPPAQREPR